MIHARLACVATLVAAFTALTTGSARAQGALTTQGFGYPPGEFSTRALGTGGGLAQFDPQTAVNPASIATMAEPLLFLQYEPEFRRFTSGTTTERSTVSRFPLAIASLPVGGRGSIAVSVSTLLDRSWATTTTRDQDIAGQIAQMTETVSSIGAINDVRLAGGWIPNRVLQIGLGAHVFTGRNRLSFSQNFPDSLRFTPVQQVSNLSYTGFGVSAGAIIRPSASLAIAISGRKGGDLDARAGDTVVASASIPDKYGIGISYEGISGATFAAQVSRDLWSGMNGLGSDEARAVDAWDGGAGIEATGPRILERVVLIRLGGRYRTLPFLAAGGEVRETSVAGGLGAQFSRNRAAFDVTVQHAWRSADAATGAASTVRERAYTLSFGLRVRP
jgi:hypothetical protein